MEMTGNWSSLTYLGRFFHAKATRDVYVQLPVWDQEEGMCAKLDKALYGTQDAAFNWSRAYTEFMGGSGFRRGLRVPSIFYHPDRKTAACVHGDDLVTSGRDVELNWFKGTCQERFETKIRVGYDQERVTGKTSLR